MKGAATSFSQQKGRRPRLRGVAAAHCNPVSCSASPLYTLGRRASDTPIMECRWERIWVRPGPTMECMHCPRSTRGVPGAGRNLEMAPKRERHAYFVACAA